MKILISKLRKTLLENKNISKIENDAKSEIGHIRIIIFLCHYPENRIFSWNYHFCVKPLMRYLFFNDDETTFIDYSISQSYIIFSYLFAYVTIYWYLRSMSDRRTIIVMPDDHNTCLCDLLSLLCVFLYSLFFLFLLFVVCLSSLSMHSFGWVRNIGMSMT